MVDLSGVGEDNLSVNGGFLSGWFGSFFGSSGSGYVGVFYGAVCGWGWEGRRRKLGFPENSSKCVRTTKDERSICKLICIYRSRPKR